MMHGLVQALRRNAEAARDQDALAGSPKARGNAAAKAGEGKSPIFGVLLYGKCGRTPPTPSRFAGVGGTIHNFI